jgi:hypothetical protein
MGLDELADDSIKLIDEVSRTGYLPQARLDHIVERHWFTSDAPKAGKFDPETTLRNLKSMIDETLEKGSHRPNTRNRPGHIFEYDFERQIGIDIQGRPASVLRLIRRPDGRIWTAFPVFKVGG